MIFNILMTCWPKIKIIILTYTMLDIIDVKFRYWIRKVS